MLLKRICRHGTGVVTSVLNINGRGQSGFNRKNSVDEENARLMARRNRASGVKLLLVNHRLPSARRMRMLSPSSPHLLCSLCAMPPACSIPPLRFASEVDPCPVSMAFLARQALAARWEGEQRAETTAEGLSSGEAMQRSFRSRQFASVMQIWHYSVDQRLDSNFGNCSVA